MGNREALRMSFIFSLFHYLKTLSFPKRIQGFIFEALIIISILSSLRHFDFQSPYPEMDLQYSIHTMSYKSILSPIWNSLQFEVGKRNNKERRQKEIDPTAIGVSRI